MKRKFFLLPILLFTLFGFCQNGINYKALIKDANGNVLSNQDVDLKFKIQLDNGSTLIDLYEESHSSTTNQNGLTILNIGEGTLISGAFHSIDWNQTILLNTQLDIEQDGTFIDLGSKIFNVVPKAFYAEKAQSAQTAVTAQTAQTANNVSGLEAASGGWRLIGENTDVGSNAVDLSQNFDGGFGATGNQSFAFGVNAHAAGYASLAIGLDCQALGSRSVAIGDDCKAIANDSYAFGTRLETNSLFSTSLGRLNIGYNNSLLEIGNGTGNEVGGFTRKNLITVFKSGNLHISQGPDTGLGTSANGYLLLGPSNGINMSIDNNEIMARNNGNAADLNLNIEGGNVLIGGNLGIGTTNPEELLHVEGIVRIGTETIEDTGLNRLSFDASLLPNVNNSTDLGATDFRWKTVYATNGTINTSDRREKKNIKDLHYGLAEILKMQPVSFNWKDPNNPDTKIGLIAQDLLELIPEAVKTHTWIRDSEADNASLKRIELDRLGVYYADLIPVLINAIKEQNEEIERLKKALISQNALEERISLLEQKISN